MDELRRPAGILDILCAIEPPARLVPRNRLELGLLPVEEQGVDSLHAAAVANLRLADSIEAVALGIRCLLALGELCRELECSERLGLIGGHQSILRLMTIESSTQQQEEEEVNEVQSAATLVASRVVSSGSAFPMRASFPGGEGASGLGRFPLRYDFVINHDVLTTVTTVAAAVRAPSAAHGRTASRGSGGAAKEDNGTNLESTLDRQLSAVVASAVDGSDARESESGADGEGISILVRPVKERQHSQFDVGFVVWPAAIILSRLLCRHPHLVRGRRVLEIGAGLGLAGLVAARIQRTPYSATSSTSGELAPFCHSGPGSRNEAAVASVTLSDFNPLVLSTLEANVTLNSSDSMSALEVCASDDCRRLESCGERRRGSPAKSASGGSHRKTPVAPVVHVRHLDWDKLGSVPGFEAEGSACDSRFGHVGHLNNMAELPPGRAAEGNEFDNGERSIYNRGSYLHSDDCAAEYPQGGTGDATKSIKRGERFDVIIASDHICQASDAEGTIRVLQEMLLEAPEPSATGGQAHFIVAHPRTRWGVDALVPLLQKTPGLAFTCEEVTDPSLVNGLEEAAFLAWLYVHVWRVSEQVTDSAAAGALLVAG